MPNRPICFARTALSMVAGLILLAAAASAGAQPPIQLPLDTETVIGGVGVGCTGIGQTKNQPRWLAYPVRVEFADAQRAYMAGEIVTLSDPRGGRLFTVACEGPWLLLRLPDSRAYPVEARLTERDTAPRTATVKSPSHGQARFVITFPDAY